jgi:hypothetical protein
MRRSTGRLKMRLRAGTANSTMLSAWLGLFRCSRLLRTTSSASCHRAAHVLRDMPRSSLRQERVRAGGSTQTEGLIRLILLRVYPGLLRRCFQ